MADRALVTGAAGSIGGELVEELVERGYAVDAWDLEAPASSSEVTGCAVDLTKPIDPAGLPTYRLVAHLAAVTENRDDRSTLTDHAASVVMAAHLLDALAAQPPRVLLTTSSQLVYAAREQHPTEISVTESSTAFVAAKLAVEAFVEAFGRRTRTPTRAFRLGNIIGATTRRGVVHDFVRRADEATGGRVRITGSPHHRRSFLGLRDCAAAMVHVGLEARQGHAVVNVANNDSMSIAEVASVVAEVTGTPFDLEAGSAALTWQGDPGTILPASAVLANSGWASRVGSREVVRDTAIALWSARRRG